MQTQMVLSAYKAMDAFQERGFGRMAGAEARLIIKSMWEHTKQITQRSHIFLLGQLLCL